MKPMLKAPGIKRLKLNYDKLLSSFAFNFNLRPYNVASSKSAAAALLAAGAAVSGRDAAGHTALAAAAADDNPRLVAALLDHGAPFDGEPGARNPAMSLVDEVGRCRLHSFEARGVAAVLASALESRN